MQSYKKLYTYWYSVLIYDLVVVFCKRWVRSYKLSEQMTGAARSGKQNIVEGSDAFSVSLKTPIKLSGVSKHSLEELIGDLEDFIRQNSLVQWSKGDPQVMVLRNKASSLVRNLSNLSLLRDFNLRSQKEKHLLSQLSLPADPEEAANFLLTLCHQATYLLSRQIEALKKKHEREGGLTEELYKRRHTFRKKVES